MSILDVKLTEAQRRGLAMLEELNKHLPLVRTNTLGMELWADRTDGYGYKGTNCSAPFARSAGKLLAALKRFGLVEWHAWSEDEYGWRITIDGQRWLHPVVLAETST